MTDENSVDNTHLKSVHGTAYSVAGSGENIVLIHGVGLNQGMWGGQSVTLSSQYQVICYDMLGHGQSKQPSDQASLEEYALQLKELLDSLHISKTSIVGFSMGGLVARAFALHYPEYLDSLVILNSVFNRTEEQRTGIQARTKEVAIKGPSANVDAAIKRWFSEEYAASSSAQINEVRNTVLNNDHLGYLTTYRLFASEDNYLADKISNIKVPTMVMTGELDPGSTPQMAHDMGNLIDNAQIVVLADQRHMMPMESPKLVNEKLLTFFDFVYLGQPNAEEVM